MLPPYRPFKLINYFLLDLRIVRLPENICLEGQVHKLFSLFPSFLPQLIFVQILFKVLCHGFIFLLFLNKYLLLIAVNSMIPITKDQPQINLKPCFGPSVRGWKRSRAHLDLIYSPLIQTVICELPTVTCNCCEQTTQSCFNEHAWMGGWGDRGHARTYKGDSGLLQGTVSFLHC